jgi:hypothetical protein
MSGPTGSSAFADDDGEDEDFIASPRTGRVMAPRSVRGTVAVSAILERAVANPVESGAWEEVTGGSIVDRAGVSEG